VSRKILVKLIAASFALVGMDAAMACSTAAWTNTGAGGGEVGNPTEGEPDDATPVRRYSGRCGLLSNTAAPSFVADVSPAAEPKYRARFYFYTGTTAGEAVVFRAADAGDASKIRVTYDGAAQQAKFYVGADGTADGTVSNVVRNRWYAVELNFSNASPAELRYTVKGAGSDTPIANDVAATAAPAGTDVIDTAQLGFVAPISATTGAITTDAFESRRNTAIGFLCRGNANTDTARNSGDLVAIRNEFLGVALAAGQPDANEDGGVNSGDLVIVRNIFLAGQGACP
jgi:hypothetical protein